MLKTAREKISDLFESRVLIRRSLYVVLNDFYCFAFFAFIVVPAFVAVLAFIACLAFIAVLAVIDFVDFLAFL